MGVLGEVLAHIVLYDQQPLGPEQLAFKDEVDERRHIGQVVGRICKDIIISRTSPLQEAQNVFAHDSEGGGFVQFFGKGTDILDTARVFVHISDVGAFAGEQFKGVAARAAEEVEGPDFFKIQAIGEDVEDGFPGRIGRWPGRPAVYGREVLASAIFAGDDSHNTSRAKALWSGSSQLSFGNQGCRLRTNLASFSSIPQR